MRSRGVKLITCWLCMYALGVGAFRWCYGNDLRQHLLEREKKLGSWTFDWHMTVCETPQSNNAPLPSEDPLLPPHQGRQYAGTMTIARRGHLTYVQQVKPAHGLPSAMPLVRHTIFRETIAYSFSQRPESVVPQLAHATVAEIWKTKGASVRCWASPPVAGRILPELLVILAGFSPAELYGGGFAGTGSRSGAMLTLSIRDPVSGRNADVTVDVHRGFCPVRMRLVHGETVSLFRVVRWRRIDGTWVPAEVNEETVRPFLKKTSRWLLSSMHQSGKHQPPPIPKGAWSAITA